MADQESHLTAEQAWDDEFRRIFEAHYRRVFRFFLSRDFPREEAHDLAQEAFLRVYRGLPGLRAEQTVETWLFRIVGNLWKSHVRHSLAGRRRGTEVSLDQWAEGEALAHLVSLPRGQEDHLLEEERLGLLRAAIAELPLNMRNCLLLRASGHSYREIAALLQVSIESVRSYIYQARQRLQAKLGGTFSDLDL